MISWLDELTFGDSIVVNVATQQVHDHVSSDGVRGEMVSELICFGSVDVCEL